MKKAEKSVFVQNLTEELKSAKSAILVDYSGLSVTNQRELKKRLKEVGARFVVVKNTLFRISSKEANLPKEIRSDTVLKGQTALVLAEADPISPLSVIAKFAKEFELPQIKVGIVEGSFADKELLVNLAEIGGKDALIAQLIGMLISPTYQLVATSEAKLRELLFVLEAKTK